MDRVQAYRASNATKPGEPFGPLPGVRLGDAVAYEWEWQVPAGFGGDGGWRLERAFVLLDVGVSLSFLDWVPEASDCWYVDLITVERDGDAYIFRDRFLDLIIPTDGRPYRVLDLDELGDALERSTLSVSEVADGLRRWQRFIDRYLQPGRYPVDGWADFPPKAIQALRDLPSPLAPPVRWSP